MYAKVTILLITLVIFVMDSVKMLIWKCYPSYKYSHHSIFRDASCVQRILMLHLSFQNPNFISGMWTANLRSSFREICFHVFEKQSNFLEWQGCANIL